MADTSEAEHAPRRRTGSWLMLALLLTVTLVTSSLAAWQVQRLAWKQDLIARVNARVAATPVSPPGRDRWPSINAVDDEYRHVTLTGTYRHDKEVTVAASTDRGPGYWVMAPLTASDGTTVYINRGFVTSDQRAPAARTAAQSAGPVTVTGLLRLSEAGAWILRKNDPAAKLWYRRAPEEMAASAGLHSVAPYFIDADATPNPGGWPVGGLTRIAFSNNHLVYALTWLCLALLSAAAAAYILYSDILGRDRNGLRRN